MTIDNFSGDYRFLSNFYLSKIVYKGLLYSTIEHGYQAAKATNEDDRESIRLVKTPREAKHLGRIIKPRTDWEVVKIGVMASLLSLKFAIPSLSEQLLATGEENLIEGNTWGDTFWGKCDGKGRNWLGRLLMLERSMIVLHNSEVREKNHVKLALDRATK